MISVLIRLIFPSGPGFANADPKPESKTWGRWFEAIDLRVKERRLAEILEFETLWHQ